MNVLLTHGYFLQEDEHEKKYMKPYPPLGLLYLSAYLKAQEIPVKVFDSTFATRAALDVKLDGEAPGLLGIYTNLMTRASVLRIMDRARGAGWRVVLGGPESAAYPEAYLERGADVVVFGEGEHTLAELIPALERDGPHQLDDVPGIAFKDEAGGIRRTPARPAIRDLDALPWPDRDAIDLDAYLRCWREHHGHASLNLITARGCPYRCRWCSHAVFGHRHARRSPTDVADEVAFLLERYRPERLWFADDVFSIDHRWLAAFAEEMGQRGLRVPFECITRADRVNAEVVAQMKDLGCHRVWLGSESGSQRVLDAMERGVKVEQVRDATKAFQAAGIEVGMFLMWGYEGEEGDDIRATIEHVKRCAPDRFLTTVAYPIKGTAYFDAVEDRIEAPDDWASATDRDHRLRGRHSPGYYAQATKRLHAEVRLHRLRGSSDLAWTRRGPQMAAALIRAAAARTGMWLRAREVEA